MLVTDASWAESQAGRQAYSKSYQAWRCVGWTDETLTFFAVATCGKLDRDWLPDGLFISGWQALIELAPQWEPGSFSVYVLGLTAGDAGGHLRQITGIWREREGSNDNEPWRWYSTSTGEMRPCFPIHLHLRERLELVNEFNFCAPS